VEIGTVSFASQTPAAVAQTEIQQVPGLSMELVDQPVGKLNYATGRVSYPAALPLSHTGSLPKQTWIVGYSPIFGDLQQTYDYVPVSETYTTSSVDTYDGAVGSQSRSLNQGTFSIFLNDGITDFLIDQAGKSLWVKFFQDRDRPPYKLEQGIIGITQDFTVGQLPGAAVTINADTKSENFAS